MNSRRIALTCWLLILALSLAACAAFQSPSEPADLVLTGATLIDGTGSEPIPDAVLVIRGQQIVAAGPRRSVTIPPAARVLDLPDAYLLPGFINAHVHFAFDEKNLQAWAYGGVTTVRDEGFTAPGTPQKFMRQRDAFNQDPRNARLVSAGGMITVAGGYGWLFVDSPEDARQKVFAELDSGVDQIKLSMEDGYAGRSNLPKLSEEEIAAILSAAHERGVRVSGHITQARYMEILVQAGVDDIAHIPYDSVLDEVWKEMAARDIYLVPTFTVLHNYGAPIPTCVQNLRNFLAHSDKVALGNDYGGGPGKFELGIPMYEIERMAEAGMTPMQIILAGTRNAAIVSGLDDQTGTLEAGKQADILVLSANPLEDLKNLAAIRMVIHSGVIIREGD